MFIFCFLLTSILIFQIPRKYEVRSSLEVASSLVGDRLEPVEAPPQIAKLIADLYRSQSAIELQQRGVAISSLAAVGDVKVEASGRNVILTNQISEAHAGVAKDFQSAIIDQAIKVGAPLVENVRLAILARVDAVTGNAGILSDRLEKLRAEANQTNRRQEGLNELLASLQNDYSDKIKRLTHQQDSQNALEDLREIRERISNQQAHSRELSVDRARIGHELLETQRLLEEQFRLQRSGKRELSTLSNFRVALSPSILPVPIANQSLPLFATAAIFSFLMAFGTIVALQKFQTSSFWREASSALRPEFDQLKIKAG